MIRSISKMDKKKLSGTVLLRLDFNTKDEWRMEAAISTIRFLLKRCEKIVILSHRGRPQPCSSSLIRANRRIGNFCNEFSLRKDALNLQKLLKKKVFFIPHFRFAEIKKLVKRAPKKSIFLLENLRFLEGEEKNDARLAKQLAELGDFFVNDAFAVSHRKNASVAAITKFLPSYAGPELEKEITFLSRAMKKPKKPLVIILGGAKAHDKLGVLRYFQNKADAFLVGGAAANTLLYLKGVDVGKSLIDREPRDLKRLQIVFDYKNLILPDDWQIEKDIILDIGKRTEKNFCDVISFARTVIWSGPMGAVEKKRFSGGTRAIARAIAANKRAFSIAGGGETVTFLKKHRLDKKFSFISTGGGAMLAFLAGEKLPGIEALRKDAKLLSLIRANDG